MKRTSIKNVPIRYLRANLLRELNQARTSEYQREIYDAAHGTRIELPSRSYKAIRGSRRTATTQSASFLVPVLSVVSGPELVRARLACGQELDSETSKRILAPIRPAQPGTTSLWCSILGHTKVQVPLPESSRRVIVLSLDEDSARIVLDRLIGGLEPSGIHYPLSELLAATVPARCTNKSTFCELPSKSPSKKKLMVPAHTRH
jgi:hypothetical protein